MKVRTMMDRHCSAEGFVRPVDILLDLDYLKKKDINDFLSGRVPYLERVCTANLSKLKKCHLMQKKEDTKKAQVYINTKERCSASQKAAHLILKENIQPTSSAVLS